MSLLNVENLNVSFDTPDGTLRAVRDVSFRLEAGKTLGIVGESGSGKSVLMQTVMGLTQGAEVSGNAYFEGTDLLTMSTSQLRDVRGGRIGMIFQDPLSSLHPYYRAGWQIVEMIEPTNPSRNATHGPARSNCSTRWESHSHRNGWMPTRTSSPAVCVNGS